MDTLHYIRLKREELLKLGKENPYNLNVIEKQGEANDNENSHSRFLCRLFQYQNDKKEFVVLKNLITYISNKKVTSDWDNIQVGKPLITQETNRIDLWVRGSNYCIIFENKICGANDRPNQLARYIDIAKSYSYTPEQIFIVYLPKEGHEGPNPDKRPWISPKTGENYEEAFNNRFIIFPFENDVNDWLRSLKEANNMFEEKDNNIKLKIDLYLSGGSISITSANDHCFRDYYMGDYYLKNDELEWLKGDLKYETITEESSMIVIKEALIDNNEKNINTKTKLLSDYLNIAYSCKFFKKNRKINLFINQLEILREQVLKEYINNSNNNLYENKIIDQDCFPYLDRNCHLGYKFTYNNNNLYLYIGNNNRNNDTRFFCSIIAGKDYFLPDFLVNKVEGILQDKGKNNKWIAGYFNEGDYSTAICLLNKVLNTLSEINEINL